MMKHRALECVSHGLEKDTAPGLDRLTERSHLMKSGQQITVQHLVSLRDFCAVYC